jgi:uncharacterized protein YxeA
VGFAFLIFYMKKILKIITGIAIIVGFLIVSTDGKEQESQIVKADSQHLLAKMTDPGDGIG